MAVWKEFNDFWSNANIPIHIIRFEDILANPKKVFTGVMQFLLTKSDLSGMAIEKYIELAVEEQAPEIYKPRTSKSTTSTNKDHFL